MELLTYILQTDAIKVIAVFAGFAYGILCASLIVGVLK